jgi:hypothetical protein
MGEREWSYMEKSTRTQDMGVRWLRADNREEAIKDLEK